MRIKRARSRIAMQKRRVFLCGLAATRKGSASVNVGLHSSYDSRTQKIMQMRFPRILPLRFRNERPLRDLRRPHPEKIAEKTRAAQKRAALTPCQFSSYESEKRRCVHILLALVKKTSFSPGKRTVLEIFASKRKRPFVTTRCYLFYIKNIMQTSANEKLSNKKGRLQETRFLTRDISGACPPQESRYDFYVYTRGLPSNLRSEICLSNLPRKLRS